MTKMNDVDFYYHFSNDEILNPYIRIYPAMTNHKVFKHETRADFVVISRGAAKSIAFVYRTPIPGATYDMEIDTPAGMVARSKEYFCEFVPGTEHEYSVFCSVTFPHNNVTVESVLANFIDTCKEDPDLVMTFKVGDVEIKAVTNLLTSRSPVIKAMMNSDCVEAKTKTVIIADFSAEIVQKFVEFCETNNVQNSKGFGMKLYKIADKYDVSEMKKMAFNYLVDKIDGTNVIKFYQFAKTYNDEEMERYCVEYGRDQWTEIHETVDVQNIEPVSVVEFLIATRKPLSPDQ